MHTRVSLLVGAALIGSIWVAGCADQTPTQPSTATDTQALSSAQRGRPGYEPAYYNGQTVTINAIELAQHAPEQAQADFYEVVYPIGWQGMGIPAPQCNPCDHSGDGDDFTDYHDHVLDSIPSDPGHGEWRALWHVYVVLPAYNNDDAHNAAVNAAYGPHLPLTSEQSIDALLATTLPDGSPVAVEVDTNFYFLCAVVDGHAAH